MAKRKYYYSYQSAGWVIDGIAMVFATKQELIDWWNNEHDMWESKDLEQADGMDQ